MFLEICTPKDVEVSSPEVYGSASEKFARKKYCVWKTGGVNNPPSVVLGLISTSSERVIPSQAARQGLAVLMVFVVVTCWNMKLQPFAKGTILYQLISNLAWVSTLGRSPTLTKLVRVRWTVETPLKNHRDFSNFIRDMERMERRWLSGWVDSIPPAGSVGRRFKYRRWNLSDANGFELFTHNYSGQLSQSSSRDRWISNSRSWSGSKSFRI